MTQATELEQIYSKLPAVAQREALDFLVFLKQRYVLKDQPPTKPSESPETVLTERDGLLFIPGRLSGDLDSSLQQERDARIDVLLQRAQG